MIVICGAGITGLTIARELIKRGFSGILILEKEQVAGRHASGRNSGVLHAGIYYSPDSLKARFAVEGNRLMREYVKEKGLPIRESGKVVVAVREEDIPILYELKRRAEGAGSVAKIIDERELREIEPYAKTVGKALHSPLTAVIDPLSILKQLIEDLKGSGRVKMKFGERCMGFQEGKVRTSRSTYPFDLFINAAGAHADRLAHLLHIGMEYRIVPFKGTYRKLVPEKSHMIRGNVYPVPDIRSPFLGVHFTRSVHGSVYVGPTAIPAFSREHYGILKGLSRESFEILMRDALLFIKNPLFRYTAIREVRKYIPIFFYRDASKLISSLRMKDLLPSGKVGIRPQLVNRETKELVMDFVVIKQKDTIHILNAISPAFTTSMAFAKWLVDEMV